jgi:hypothetical protein
VPATEVVTLNGFPIVVVVKGTVVHVKLFAAAPVVAAVIESGAFRHIAVSFPALTVHCDFAECTLKKEITITGRILVKECMN